MQTERTTVKRLSERGRYDEATIHAILDEALLCHIGFVVNGAPVVIPTIHWREGDTLYVHGSVASRMLRTLRNGIDACVTVTLLDGLVLAKSAFHHSMNYRSVVILGKLEEVMNRAEKIRSLDGLVEHVIKGRSKEVRAANESELRVTTVLKMKIEEASAKIRTGGPVDDEADMDLPVWAGVLPMTLTPGEPSGEGEAPGYVKNYVR